MVTVQFLFNLYFQVISKLFGEFSKSLHIYLFLSSNDSRIRKKGKETPKEKTSHITKSIETNDSAGIICTRLYKNTQAPSKKYKNGPS